MTKRMIDYVTKKLHLFGLADLAAEGKRFGQRRNELVHEKAVEISELTPDAIHIAQEEAKRAMCFVKQVAEGLVLKG
jgi:hypothetical protein